MKIKRVSKTEKVLQLSEISLWLDTYDDIFSDFDPRPYSLRSLSDDLLREIKKAIVHKSKNKFELRFLIPKNKRNLKDEATIKERIHNHFETQIDYLKKEVFSTRAKGILFFLFGTMTITLTTSFEESIAPSFLKSLIVNTTVPLGWFIVWFALEKVFYIAIEKKAELKFNKRMSNCDIIFVAY